MPPKTATKSNVTSSLPSLKKSIQVTNPKPTQSSQLISTNTKLPTPILKEPDILKSGTLSDLTPFDSNVIHPSKNELVVVASPVSQSTYLQTTIPVTEFENSTLNSSSPQQDAKSSIEPIHTLTKTIEIELHPNDTMSTELLTEKKTITINPSNSIESVNKISDVDQNSKSCIESSNASVPTPLIVESLKYIDGCTLTTNTTSSQLTPNQPEVSPDDLPLPEQFLVENTNNKLFNMGLRMSLLLSVIQAGVCGKDKQNFKEFIEISYQKELGPMLMKSTKPGKQQWLFAIFKFWKTKLPLAMSFFATVAIVGALLIIYFAKARKTKRKNAIIDNKATSTFTVPHEVSLSTTTQSPFSFITNLFRKRKREE
jgi:hypothetical protein